MDTTAPLPISVESLARNFFQTRKEHEEKKLFFKIGDEVHVIQNKKILNGLIRNYDGKHKYPYEVFMMDGTTQRFTVNNLRAGHLTTFRDSTKRIVKQPSLIIIHSVDPVVVKFD